ncbi:MAG TPA: 3-phosphoserine/phosphohydroxythreonine transaminase [Bacteroidia bacterium]
MSKVHNFSAGPSILPQEALEASIEGIRNFAGTGLSVLEVSHRGKEFVAVVEETQSIIKELLGVPQDYEVLFLGGGASLQFLMVAYNLLETKGAYLKTGVWAANAVKEAKYLGKVEVVASSEDKNYNYIPKDYVIPTDADYFHCTSNNTIYGSQMTSFPDSPVTLVCDMSSDILSKRIDASKFGLIYAGAQKNMGPAGVTVVIIKKDILGKVSRQIPSMMNYQVHIDKETMFNTPPVFPIFAMLQNLKWVKKVGGVDEMQRRAAARAALLYNEVDRNPLFTGTVATEDRSQMNACFLLTDPSMEDKFNAAWKEAKISGIKGHRSVGGYRASMYNALPLESVEALVNVMSTFN